MRETVDKAKSQGGHRVGRIEDDMPASSPEVSDDDPMMKTSFDDDSTPEPASVHDRLTMEQAHAHFNAAMVEEQPTLTPTSLFGQA